jgi:Lipocalin-like domain
VFLSVACRFSDSKETDMQTSIMFLIGFALCAVSAFGQTEAQIRDRIVGTWKLVSTQEIKKDGTTRPFAAFGPHAKGFLMYQRDSYMCGQLVNPDRLKWSDPAHATPEEKVAVADGSFAYCGRYEIDVKQEWIIHLPEVATDPGYVGSRQIRPYRFEGGHLIFSDAEKNDPSVASWKLVWEKVQ